MDISNTMVNKSSHDQMVDDKTPHNTNKYCNEITISLSPPDFYINTEKSKKDFYVKPKRQEDPSTFLDYKHNTKAPIDEVPNTPTWLPNTCVWLPRASK